MTKRLIPSIILIIILLIAGIRLYFFYYIDRYDLDYIVAKEWKNNKSDTANCIIELAELMPFEWDSMQYYLGSWTAFEIEEIFSTGRFDCSLDSYKRVLFFHKGRIIHFQEWYTYPFYEHNLESVGFANDSTKFTILKNDAKFQVRRRESYYLLYKIE